MQDEDAQQQAHGEAADVREVVQPGQEAQRERDEDVDEQVQQVAPRRGPVRPRVGQVDELESDDTEQRARSSRGSDACGRKVPSQHEAEDAAGEVDEREAHRADLTLHVPPDQHLQQQVESDVDEPRMQEDGDHEPEPLVRLRAGRQRTVGDRVRDGRFREAAQIGEGALHGGRVQVVGGRVRAGPTDGLGGVLDARGRALAGDEARAHVDEDVGGGAYHGVEDGLGLDGGVGQFCCEEKIWSAIPSVDYNTAAQERILHLLFTASSAMKTRIWMRVMR